MCNFIHGHIFSFYMLFLYNKHSCLLAEHSHCSKHIIDYAVLSIIASIGADTCVLYISLPTKAKNGLSSFSRGL